MNILITYDGDIDPDIDEVITGALESIGAVFEGSGVCLDPKERDISFTLDENTTQE